MSGPLAATLIAIALLVPAVSGAAPPAPGQEPVEWCLLEDGEVVDQPAGSPIAACCAADGCIICDASWNNCHFEPAAGGRGAGAVLPGIGAPDTLAPSGTAVRPDALPQLGGTLQRVR